MSIYAVGDIQGCYDPLMRCLEKAQFDQSKDELWCVGDLVNRGPDSLKVIRFLIGLGDQCTSVLGNHDIHLMAMISNNRSPKPRDSLSKILRADDREDIYNWLRKKPLLKTNKSTKTLLCHAGVYPWWSVEQAQVYANEVETVFNDREQCLALLSKIYSNSPSKWDDSLINYRRHRFIINAFTRMRFCSPKGHLNLVESGFVGKIRKNRQPWFFYKNASLNEFKIIFGHWSSVGLYNKGNYLGLDSGCVWGNPLTVAKIPNTGNSDIVFYTSD